MVGEGTTAITITFALAILGYVGLTAAVLLSLRGRLSRAFWIVVALVVATHVAMVWTFRYHFTFALAVRNGYAGFALFHTALALILAAVVAPERMAHRLIHVAFGIVTAGALGASFIYDVVAIYRAPVVVCAVVGAVALVRHYGRRLRGARIRPDAAA